MGEQRVKGKGEGKKKKIALCTYSVLLANYLLKEEKRKMHLKDLTRTFSPEGNFVLDTVLLNKAQNNKTKSHLRQKHLTQRTLTFWEIVCLSNMTNVSG